MYNIKFIFFFILIAVATAADLPDPLKEMRAQCRKECHVTEDTVTRHRNDLRSISAYVGCMARATGSVRENGLLNFEQFAQTVAFASPPAIIKPISECCIKQVYGDNRTHFNRHEATRRFVDFAICVKSQIPGELFDLVGLLEPSKWDALKTCPV